MDTRTEASGVVFLPDSGTPLPTPEQDSPVGFPVAIGESISTERLIDAYQKGIFPWFDYEDRLMTWWCPDPRAVFVLDGLELSPRQCRRLKNSPFRFSMDTAFKSVIAECAASRPGRIATWISSRILQTYCELSEAGLAHSVEVWRDDQLVGGLYGVSMGRMFFGESMFHRESNSSKLAFWALVNELRNWEFTVIDAQYMTPHLRSLGAIEVSRSTYLSWVHANSRFASKVGAWDFDTA